MAKRRWHKGSSRKSIIFGFRSVNTINKIQKIKWIFIIFSSLWRWHRIAGPNRIASICNAHQISVVVVFLSRYDDVDCLLFFVWSFTVFEMVVAVLFCGGGKLCSCYLPFGTRKGCGPFFKKLILWLLLGRKRINFRRNWRCFAIVGY